MKSKVFIIVVCLAFSSCSTLFVGTEERNVFKTFKSVRYPYKEIENQFVTESLQNVLTDKEVLILENFSVLAPFLENLVETECAGCTNTFGRFKPMYRLKKGKFIHFGLQTEMGVENWVFKKNGALVTRFYTFQGESREEIQEALKDVQSINYILEGVYPIQIDDRHIYLEHVEFEYQSNMNDQWYQPMFPTKIGYAIDLTEKSQELCFKVNGGLFSYQKPDKKGEPQIINFVEPLMYANAVAIDEPMSYSSFTDAFYANATFFLLNIEERSNVSISMKSRLEGKEFKFSVLENDGFHTIEEYVQKGSPLFNRYQNIMEKGSYLIRMLHENADYAEKPLYTVYINKKTVD